MVQKVAAPSAVRKAPEIFCLSFGMRRQRGALLRQLQGILTGTAALLFE
jgi:hypothetical protein